MLSIQETAREISILAPQVMAGVKGGFMASEDVTAQQMITILTLQEAGRVKITQLSRKMGVAPPTITGIIDRLERTGYVRRIRDSADRRVVFVTLTERGLTFVGKLKKSIQQRWMKIMVYLSQEERGMYVRILRKIAEGLKRDADEESDETG